MAVIHDNKSFYFYWVYDLKIAVITNTDRKPFLNFLKYHRHLHMSQNIFIIFKTLRFRLIYEYLIEISALLGISLGFFFIIFNKENINVL